MTHRLGRGGMGDVYAGVDETLKRRVALKAIRAEHRLNAQSKARFLREAQILSQLDHPHICRVYNYVEAADSDWLVLEFIEGRTLHDEIRRGVGAADRMSIAQQIAEVLVVTHAAGVVHRDLKPGNVMLAGAAGVKVLDFGLARALPADGDGERGSTAGADGAPAHDGAIGANDAGGVAGAPPAVPGETRLPGPAELPTMARSASDAAPETEGGALLGTLAYMSPEQARGEPATTASDLYSLGLILQELYTGQPPYPETGDFAALLDHARRGEVPAPSGLDPDLTRLIQRLKAFAPSERPTAVDTLDRLRWIAAKPRRRVRRLAAAAVITLAALGAVKYFIDLRTERTAALEARREAEGRRTQAEDLIGFMLGDLRKKLEQVGRLEILDEVGAKAMDYFAAVPEASLSDEELAQRSAALYQIGEVRITQGRMAEAEQPLTQSLALARSLSARHPDDGQRLFDLAQSHFWVGFVDWRQRRLDAALVHFREYLRIAQRLVSIDSANVDWQIELASANSNIGSVLEEQGDLAGALERFHAALDVESALLQKQPDDNTLRRNVAASNNAVGAVLRASGDLADALSHHRAELALQQELVRREPGTAAWRQYLSVSHNRVAMLLEAMGQVDEAAGHAAEAMAITARLGAEDPSNVDWQRELGISHYRAGTIADARGARGEAQRHLSSALAIMARVARRDALNPARQRDLADVHAALAQHHLAAGDASRAIQEARAAQVVAERLLAKSADDRQAGRLLGLALSLQGRAWVMTRDVTKARAAWMDAARVLEPPARRSRDYLFLRPWAMTLAGLERTGEAKEVLEALGAMGYQHPLLAHAITRGGVSTPLPVGR